MAVLPGTRNTKAVTPEAMEVFRKLFCRYGDSGANVELIKAVFGVQQETAFFPPPEGAAGSKISAAQRGFEAALPYAGKPEWDWCRKGSGGADWYSSYSVGASPSSGEVSYVMNRGYFSWIPYALGFSPSSITQTLPLCQEISVWMDTVSGQLREEVATLFRELEALNGISMPKEEREKIFDKRLRACLTEATGGKREDVETLVDGCQKSHKPAVEDEKEARTIKLGGCLEEGLQKIDVDVTGSSALMQCLSEAMPTKKDVEEIYRKKREACFGAIENIEEGYYWYESTDGRSMVRQRACLENVCEGARKMVVPPAPVSTPKQAEETVFAAVAALQGEDVSKKGGMGNELEAIFGRNLEGLEWNKWVGYYDFCVPASSEDRYLFVVGGSIASLLVGTVVFLRYGITAASYLLGSALMSLPIGDRFGLRAKGRSILDWLKKRAEEKRLKKAARAEEKAKKKVKKGDKPKGPQDPPGPAPTGKATSGEGVSVAEPSVGPVPDPTQSMDIGWFPGQGEIIEDVLSPEVVTGVAVTYGVARVILARQTGRAVAGNAVGATVKQVASKGLPRLGWAGAAAGTVLLAGAVILLPEEAQGMTSDGKPVEKKGVDWGSEIACMIISFMGGCSNSLAPSTLPPELLPKDRR